ncbi:hypothetical protein Q7P35_006119 [Cladosporium inversicolor]
MQRDEESDDDEPNPYLKKQEAEDSQRLERIPAYTPRQKAAVAKGETGDERDSGSQVPDSSIVGKNDENDEYESSSEADSDSDSTSDTSSSLSSDSESDSSTPYFPLVAVLRGQTLPKDYVPPKGLSRAKKRRLKHIRYARRNPNNRFQAVIRGEVVEEKHDTDIDEKKGVVSRNRGRGEAGGLGGEGRGLGRKGKKSKRA